MTKAELETENARLRKVIQAAIQSMENNGMGNWPIAKKLRAAITAGERADG